MTLKEKIFRAIRIAQRYADGLAGRNTQGVKGEFLFCTRKGQLPPQQGTLVSAYNFRQSDLDWIPCIRTKVQGARSGEVFSKASRFSLNAGLVKREILEKYPVRLITAEKWARHLWNRTWTKKWPEGRASQEFESPDCWEIGEAIYERRHRENVHALLSERQYLAIMQFWNFWLEPQEAKFLSQIELMKSINILSSDFSIGNFSNLRKRSGCKRFFGEAGSTGHAKTLKIETTI